MIVRLAKTAKADLVYEMTVQFDDGNHVVVEGPYAQPVALDLGYVRFEPGDRFLEHYWRDRWYSVKEVRCHEGRMKGWYCDIARPVDVASGKLTSVDLELDLWVSADGGTVMTLDEDEFVASGLQASDPIAAANARAALAELCAAAKDLFVTILNDSDA